MSPPVDTAAAPPSPRYEVRPWGRASAYAGAPSPRKILVASRGVVRALDKAMLPVALTIMEVLPVDLLVEVMLILFYSWPCWPRLFCVSASLAAAAEVARQQLRGGEWWTGTGLPLIIPLQQPAVDMSSLFAHGERWNDSDRGVV